MAKFRKITTQVTAYYAVLLIVSMLISGFIYQRINSNLVEKKIEDLAKQTLHAVYFSLQIVFDNTNKFSKHILASSVIQEVLIDNSASLNLAESNRLVQRVFNEILLVDTTVASVYLFRNDGLYYAWDKLLLGVKPDSITKANWFSEVIRLDGGALWVRDAGDVLNERSDKEKYLSLVRTVNNLVTAEKIGLLMINIPISEIKKSYAHTLDEESIDLMVCKDGVVLIDFSRLDIRTYFEEQKITSYKPDSQRITIGKKRYILTDKENNGWQFLVAIPMSYWQNPYDPINKAIIPIAIVNFVLIFFGSIWISRTITRPLLCLLESMRSAERGLFKK